MVTKKQSAFGAEFLKKIEGLLNEEKTRLEEELGAFTTKNPHVSGDYDAVMPNYGDKDDENALEVAEYTANKPLEMSLENTLRDVKKALERLRGGAYGECKYCHKSIDEKRLLARPTSSACVSCKKTLTDEV
ncbi:MAG: TraR/DksA C4-type zinc finger protein [Candidatus Magasanikbacteria bacterium]|nr:TraR/DksA C4-type zinc finger protein [Candidatus Magasanikbacteria bacterium]